MRKYTALAALLLATPSLVSANGYENIDYATAYFQDAEGGATPIGVGGRYGISPTGKIIGDITYFSDEVDLIVGTATTSVTSLRAGYRHTLGEFDFLEGGIWSIAGGLTYFSSTTESDVAGFPDVETSDTDFFIEGDVEYPVGLTGVAHGVVVYQNDNLDLGGGYTYYLGNQFGIRGELLLDGPIEIGVNYRF